ncbi:MAG: UvrB/UvrC motif-containing protein [Treponema sp.]|nr:UvrB/UvrC motif-containing protein [Treponema sp.]
MNETICDFCHTNNAVFFIEQVNPQGKRKLNLCMECAAKNGVTPDPKSLEKSVGGLFAQLAKISKKLAEEESRVCPVCGTSLAIVRRTRHAGCPECYAIFKDDIQLILKNLGADGQYTGSMPNRLRNFRSVLNDRIVLRTKLEESLKKEDYEKAALYRDYLRALEKRPVSGGEQ